MMFCSLNAGSVAKLVVGGKISFACRSVQTSGVNEVDVVDVDSER